MKIGEDGKKLRTAGEICRTVGIKPSSLRVYEEKKPRLVKPTQVKRQNSLRTDSRGTPVELRNKWYGASEMMRVMLIVMCRKLGFSLNEIGELLDRTEAKKDGILQNRLCELEAERERIDRQIEMLHILSDLGDTGQFVFRILHPYWAELYADMVENIRLEGDTGIAGEKNEGKSDTPSIVYDREKTELVRIAKQMKKQMKDGYCRTPQTAKLAEKAKAYFTKTYALDAVIPEPDSLPGRAFMLLPITVFLTGGGEVTRKTEEAAGQDAGWLIASAIAHEFAADAVKRLQVMRTEYEALPDEAGKAAYLEALKKAITEKLKAWNYGRNMEERLFSVIFGDEKEYRAIWEDLLSACSEPDLLSDDTFPGIFICLMRDILWHTDA